MGTTQQLVNQLQSSVSAFDQKMNVELKKVDKAAEDIDITTKKIYNKVVEFKNSMEKNETKQLAFENTIRIDQQLEEKLKFYNDVRRVVIGVVHDYDVNLVRNKTISELSEELWMGASKYWLSYALIAISAWIMDDEELAKNALKMGMQYDPVNFSLFFALFNMKFGKSKVAKVWLITYFNQVNPKDPGNELAVLLQAYLTGAFGDDAQLASIVDKSIEKWQRELDEDIDVSDDLKNGYYEYLVNKVGFRAFKSETLDEYCNNLDEFKTAYQDMAKYEVIENEIDNIIKAKKSLNKGNIKALIDKVINQLIYLPDPEEEKLQDEKKFNELIMDAEGDLKAAEKQYRQYLSLKKKQPNIGKTMLRWVLFANENEVTPLVKKFSLQQTKGWYVDGLQKMRSEQQMRRPRMFNLKIDIWSSPVDGTNLEEAEKSVENTLNTDKLSKSVFKAINIVFFIIAVAVALIAIPVIKANQTAGLIMFGIAAVLLLIVVIIIVATMAKYPKRIAAVKTILGKCFDEINRYNKEYDALDQKGADLSVKLYNINID